MFTKFEKKLITMNININVTPKKSLFSDQHARRWTRRSALGFWVQTCCWLCLWVMLLDWVSFMPYLCVLLWFCRCLWFCLNYLIPLTLSFSHAPGLGELYAFVSFVLLFCLRFDFVDTYRFAWMLVKTATTVNIFYVVLTNRNIDVMLC